MPKYTRHRTLTLHSGQSTSRPRTPEPRAPERPAPELVAPELVAPELVAPELAVDSRPATGDRAQRGSAIERSRGRLGAVALCAAALLAGCGHKATEAECERIVVRITELELEAAQVSDPKNVNQQIERTKQTFAESVQRDCVGRRISDDTMACVDQATDAKRLVEECFD